MDQKIIVSSLAMDLKRVALGLHKESFKVAERFKQEAFKRADELEKQSIDVKLARLVKKMRQSLASDDERVAEDALMYSTLFQNYALKKL